MTIEIRNTGAFRCLLTALFRRAQTERGRDRPPPVASAMEALADSGSRGTSQIPTHLHSQK